MTTSLLVASVLFALGLIVGSFLNVCIWRIPAGEQVVKGRSHCRGCGRRIVWYDNVPVVSFLLLKGRCRHCGSRISWVYPAVELAAGLLFAALYWRFGLTARAVVYGALGAGLLLVSVVDAREMILPDQVTLPGFFCGLGLSLLFPALHGAESWWQGGLLGLAGAVVGGGFIWLIGLVGSWIFKREAMGGGDVKLMAMVGSLIGFQKVLLVNLFLAPLVGSIVGLFLKYRFGRDLIPYGPFLSLGTLLAVFWGDAMINWYFSLFMRG